MIIRSACSRGLSASSDLATTPTSFRVDPALDGVEQKLKTGAKVADVGCGHGASTLLMAQGYRILSFSGSTITVRRLIVLRFGEGSRAAKPHYICKG